MAVRRHGRVSRPGPKRSTVWLDVNIGEDIVAASTITVLGVLNAAALAFRPFTIVRTRLAILYGTDQNSANESPRGAFGMIVVNDKAAALGVTAIPGPISRLDDDWYVWQG